nr:MAG TPA: hypothetical protein [Caudoviricetes sp.]
MEIRSVERRDSKPCVGRPAGSGRAAMVRNWNVLGCGGQLIRDAHGSIRSTNPPHRPKHFSRISG